MNLVGEATPTLLDAQKLSKTGSFSWRPVTGDIFWSEETYRIYEYDPDTKPTIEWARERIHPDDLHLFDNRVTNGPNEDADFSYEHRLLMPDGRVKTVKVAARLVHNAKGEVVEIIGAVMDITEQTRMVDKFEQTLLEAKRAKQQFRLAIDTIPGLVWTSLPDGHIDFLNQRWLVYTGLSNSEAEGWGWQQTIHPDDLGPLVEYWKSILISGEPGDYVARMRRFDGVYRWFLFRGVPSYDEYGVLVKWYGQTTDIHDRKIAEFFLEDERNILELIARAHSLSDILSALCLFVEKNIDESCCVVELKGQVEHRFVQAIGPSFPSGYNIDNQLFSKLQNPCAMAAHLGVAIIIENISVDTLLADTEWKNRVSLRGFLSCWSFPVFSSKNELEGVLALYSRKPGNPTEKQIALINQFVYLAGIAIERARTQSALKRSEDHLAKAQELSRSGSFGFNPFTQELTWSKETYSILGYSTDTKPHFNLILQRTHPDDMEEVNKLFETIISKQHDFELYQRIIMPDGAIKHLHVVAHTQQLSREQFEYVGAVVDITEREHAVRALNTSEQLARGQVAALLGTLDALAKESLPEKSIEHVLQTIALQLNAQCNSVWLKDDSSGELTLEFGFENGILISNFYAGEPSEKFSLIANDNWPWPMVSTTKPYLICDIRNEVASLWRDQMVANNIISVLMIPLLVAGKVEGVVGICFSEQREIRIEEIELAQALTHQLMLTVQLTRLSIKSRETAIVSERNRMAREIHDTLAHGLTGVIVQLEAAIDAASCGLADEMKQHIENASDLAREGLREARSSVRALRPRQLEDGGLIEALAALMNKMTSGTAISNRFFVEGHTMMLSTFIDENLLRIGQEILTNAIRHANPSIFSLNIHFKAEEIRAQFCDNGCGFNVDDTTEGFGLAGIRERVSAMNGTIHIQSAPQEGTKIEIVIPLVDRTLIGNV